MKAKSCTHGTFAVSSFDASDTGGRRKKGPPGFWWGPACAVNALLDLVMLLLDHARLCCNVSGTNPYPKNSINLPLFLKGVE